ncbi:unnamed protein product [Malus baccata var. baccata]
MMNYTKLTTPSHKAMLSDHLKNQNLDQAHQVFNEIPFPSVDLYTMMITGYVQIRRLDDALKLFYEMPEKDTVSWNSMIKGCLDSGDLSKVKELFDGMPGKKVVSWTTIMNGFLQFGDVEMAERLFREMPVGMWCNGRVEDAKKLFKVIPCKNVISWTLMIGGLDRIGRTDEAFFCKFVRLDLGVQIHGQIVKLGYCFDEFVAASLITLYANCKQMENSYRVFNESLHKNVVVWTALLTGCGLNCQHEDALKVFRDMMKWGVLPNQLSFISALNSCGGLDLDQGKETQTAAVNLGFETDVFLGNSLIVFYTKCRSMNGGVSVFKRIGDKNIVSWNSTIVGCAQHVCGMWALTLFNRMTRTGVEPDERTFTGLLSACSHSGMLQKARHFIKFFCGRKSVEVKLEHYACMVDALGRSGELEEAEELIKNMPVQANKTLQDALIEDFDPHCSAAYVLLSNLYASANRWRDVSRIREKMRHCRTGKQPGCSWIEGRSKEVGYIFDHNKALSY